MKYTLKLCLGATIFATVCANSMWCAKINETVFSEKYSLHKAAANGNIKKALEILKNNKNLIDTRDQDGNTPIWHACYNKHKDMVKVLVNIGANFYLENQNNCSPYQLAEKQLPTIHAYFELYNSIIGLEYDSKNRPEKDFVIIFKNFAQKHFSTNDMIKNIKTWKDSIKIAKLKEYTEIKHKLYDVGFELFQTTGDNALKVRVALKLPAWFSIFLFDDKEKITQIEQYKKAQNYAKILKFVERMAKYHKNLIGGKFQQELFDLYSTLLKKKNLTDTPQTEREKETLSKLNPIESAASVFSGFPEKSISTFVGYDALNSVCSPIENERIEEEIELSQSPKMDDLD